jgi:hypothetical protein
MPVCEDKFWLENYSDLFCEIDPIPLASMSLNRQLNAMTRLFFLLTLLMAPMCGPKSIFFFIAGLIFIIILFYTLRNMDCRENFQPCSKLSSCGKPITRTQKPNRIPTNEYSVSYSKPKLSQLTRTGILNSNRQNPPVFTQLQYGPDFFSVNQALAGKPAARTMIPPVRVAPAFSSEWRENSLVVRSGINSETSTDLTRSGYLLSKEAINGTVEQGCIPSDANMELVRSTYTPLHDVVEGYTPAQSNASVDIQEPFRRRGRCSHPDHNIPHERGGGQRTEISNLMYSGDVLVTDGYYPEQIMDNNLPNNLNVGFCAKDEEFNEYNKQMYTSTLQPGVYTRNQIIEPISSNIGISFTQQFEHITPETDKYGTTFIGHDPNVMELPHEKKEEIFPYDRQTHISDIYDPRHTGAGTSYRSYVEPMTGRVRYYYDDVDAHKRPSFLCRSNVDHIPSSIGVQAIPNDEYFNKQNRNARAIAGDAFLNDTLNFRTEMQERLMRKGNAVAAQARMYPKHTSATSKGSMCNPRG